MQSRHFRDLGCGFMQNPDSFQIRQKWIYDRTRSSLLVSVDRPRRVSIHLATLDKCPPPCSRKILHGVLELSPLRTHLSVTATHCRHCALTHLPSNELHATYVHTENSATTHSSAQKVASETLSVTVNSGQEYASWLLGHPVATVWIGRSCWPTGSEQAS